MENEPCLLYAQDPVLVRKVQRFLEQGHLFKHLAEPADFRRCMDQNHPAVALLDSRGAAFPELLAELRTTWSDSLAIVIGPPRSDPVIQAQAGGAYAVLDSDFSGLALKQAVRQAFDRLALVRQLRLLQASSDERPVHRETAVAPPPVPQSLRYCFPPWRRFDDVRALLQGTIDSIVNAGVVFRAAIFVQNAERETYCFEAGIGCSDETRTMELPVGHPLVRWLHRQPQLICRSGLQHVMPPSDRLMLERVLDRLQAELMVPLQGRNRIIGWIILGRLATGAPFSASDLQDVMILAERVSTALENAILYSEADRQRTFAAALLHSIPTGIVAARADGQIQWFNEAAEAILGVARGDVLEKPVEALGNRLSARLRLALAGQPPPRDREWLDQRTRRYLSVEAVRLMSGERCTGAVAFVHDHTRERMLTKRQRELDRSAFWTELAANMSHEIRNPLVTIKTFAQLLPERFEDPDFRSEFSVLVTQEVDRLNSLIEQINSFADFPQPVFQAVDVNETIREGIRLAGLRVPTGGVQVKTSSAHDLPKVNGDKQALAQCVAHVFANALEAVKGVGKPAITLTAQTVQNGKAPQGVEICVRDNGRGIDSEIRDKVFSPFCTTRQGGMGLGLPIVQRTMVDHNGQVHIDSDEHGTRVSILLPAYGAAAEDFYEAPVDRG